jgi:hypothetical protein
MGIAGVVGGVFAASASHPFDTIKTRMQAAMYSKPEYLTWTSTAATIYKEGGVLNFWRGLLPRMTRIIGAWHAVVLSVCLMLVLGGTSLNNVVPATSCK